MNIQLIIFHCVQDDRRNYVIQREEICDDFCVTDSWPVPFSEIRTYRVITGDGRVIYPQTMWIHNRPVMAEYFYHD